MFNEKTKKKIDELEELELEVAEKWGVVYNSYHEAWAVLKEEVQEATEETDGVVLHFSRFWDLIRENDGEIDNELREEIEWVRLHTVSAISELAQVLAVLRKFDQTITMIEDNKQGARK